MCKHPAHELVALGLSADALEAESGVDGVVGGDDRALRDSSVTRSQPTTGLAVPSGDGPSCQPPVSDSKLVDVGVPSSVTVASSTQTPRPSVPQSVMTEIETSIFLPA